MVEVDVFWAYAIGGSCAVAAGTPVARASAPIATPQFTLTLLLLSLLWAPTGLLLLLRHPSWETMQVADSFAAIPPWLVLAFGITNITQGIVGFWVGAHLLARGRVLAANLSWIAGYFAMFFVLLLGWDGLGYDRFLYDRDMFGGVAWTPGAGLQPGAGIGFLRSTVAQTLYLDGLFLLPALLGLLGRWQQIEARRRPGSMARRSVAGWALVHLAIVFGCGLGGAAVAAIVVAAIFPIVGHVPGYVIGLPLALWAQWALLYARGRPLRRLLTRALGLPDRGA